MNNERGDITDTLNKCCRNLLSKIGVSGFSWLVSFLLSV